CRRYQAAVRLGYRLRRPAARFACEQRRHRAGQDAARVAAVTFQRGRGTLMNVENALYPTADRIADLTVAESDQPIVMLTLLKFRERAQYADGRATELSGRDAYMLYGTKMQQVVEREGGRMIFSGEVMSVVIGAVDEVWDVAALVEYPSSSAFAR